VYHRGKDRNWGLSLVGTVAHSSVGRDSIQEDDAIQQGGVETEGRGGRGALDFKCWGARLAGWKVMGSVPLRKGTVTSLGGVVTVKLGPVGGG